MPIFYNKKAIFIRVPKTAGVSITKAIGGVGSGPIHEGAVELKNRVSEEDYNNFFKFSFVRNPWDWFLSWAYYKIAVKEKTIVGKRRVWESFDFNGWVEGLGRVTESRGGVYWTPSIEYGYNSSGSVSCGMPGCRARMGFYCICLICVDIC